MEKLITIPWFLSIDNEAITLFLTRFGLNLLFLLVLVWLLYFRSRRSGNPEHLFSFVLLGIIVFLICTVLDMVVVQLGFALGLFALFGILRYRTETIPVREMTYMFLVIGLSIVNSLVDFNDPVAGIILLNTLVLIPVWLLEIFVGRYNIRKRDIVYDILEDVNLPEAELINKLKEKMGLDIKKARVEKVDYVAKKANITIYYRGK